MKKINCLLGFIAAAFLLFSSCAKEVNESADTVEQRLLDAYIFKNYIEQGVNIQPTASGLYFIPQSPQYAGTSPAGDDFLYMRCTSRSIDETIGSTSVDSLAKMLGTHSKKNYYGPQLYMMSTGTAVRGLQEGFSYMAPGDKARIIMPSWLSNYIESGTRAYSSPTIHDLELLGVVPDIAAFQTDSLKQYSIQNFGGVDSLKYDWYFVSTTPGNDTLPVAGDTIKIRYAGYLLDGFLFDSNIQSVADFHYGDEAATSYDELTVIMNDEVSNMGVVEGFGLALQNMSDGEKATTFFSSDYGYGATTQGQIQPYSMLRFDIEVTIARKSTDTE
ncbi:MAG: FKBP-type peptidyl-prolyl cis-trans isomerase [Bacteroidales bacterium]|nr:FKBP-type peptidyl-prolyl cis-trans isomerase [Bacteroidales bacterium]MCL2133629.1 FKBP-type peptidyl-prolyl cis-trans isomerase [Bacteroidales bacterium]